eukprot:scaffold44_cov411-Prasinococcus_capsulatus_cf.AAC.52
MCRAESPLHCPRAHSCASDPTFTHPARDALGGAPVLAAGRTARSKRHADSQRPCEIHVQGQCRHRRQQDSLLLVSSFLGVSCEAVVKVAQRRRYRCSSVTGFRALRQLATKVSLVTGLPVPKLVHRSDTTWKMPKPCELPCWFGRRKRRSCGAP